MEEKNQPLASEMYEDLKKANRFKEILIYILLAVNVALGAGLVATNLYHIHQWSQFDTYVVDSDGGGYSNLIQGDNSGGINNGANSSKTAEGRQG